LSYQNDDTRTRKSVFICHRDRFTLPKPVGGIGISGRYENEDDNENKSKHEWPSWWLHFDCWVFSCSGLIFTKLRHFSVCHPFRCKSFIKTAWKNEAKIIIGLLFVRRDFPPNICQILKYWGSSILGEMYADVLFYVLVDLKLFLQISAPIQMLCKSTLTKT